VRPRRGRSRAPRRTQGAQPNDNNLDDRGWREEPGDHGIGRSRGGLTCKTHALVDGLGRPLTLIVTPGQAGDCPVLPRLLAELRVARNGPGRPRTTPEAVRGDKAYSSRAGRELLRARGIASVIPERADQIGHRLRRGSTGGRPVGYDTEDYKARNVVERFFNRMKNWRALATRYDCPRLPRRRHRRRHPRLAEMTHETRPSTTVALMVGGLGFCSGIGGRAVGDVAAMLTGAGRGQGEGAGSRSGG